MNFLNQELSRKIQTLKKELSGEKKLVFLLIGRTGVGKSSTINSLIGREVAKTGKYDPTTMSPQKYDCEINGVNFTVIDTPGLCDDLPDKGNDKKYIEFIKSQTDTIDCLWFVTRLDEPRVTADEMRGIKIISEEFSPEIWKHSIIIFTRADKADNYLEDLRERKKRIRSIIEKFSGTGIANSIPAIAVANGHEKTPDGEKWLGELWTKVFIRVQEKGALPFLMSTIDRINYGSQSESNFSNSKSTYRIKFRSKSATKDNDSTYKEKGDSANQKEKRAKKKHRPKVEFSKEQNAEVRKRLFTVVPILKDIGKAVGATVGAFVGGKSGKSLGKEVGKDIGGVVGMVIDFCFSFF